MLVKKSSGHRCCVDIRKHTNRRGVDQNVTVDFLNLGQQREISAYIGRQLFAGFCGTVHHNDVPLVFYDAVPDSPGSPPSANNCHTPVLEGESFGKCRHSTHGIRIIPGQDAVLIENRVHGADLFRQDIHAIQVRHYPDLMG